MTGHAFQVLSDDEDLRISLTAIRSVLTPNGRFIFETRNPLARGWEAWVPENAVEIVDATGAVVRMAHRVEKIDKDLVTFIATFSSSSWDEPKRSRSTLKFLSALSLSLFLTDAGLAVAKQFGDWDRQPLTESSPEIITIAHREE